MAGSYTRANLKDDVEDMARKADMPEEMSARFAKGDLELEKSGLSHQTLAPGFRQPFGHSHGEQEEVYVIVAGGGKAALDDEVIEVRQWDAIRVSPETVRAFEAGPEGIELLAFGAAGEELPKDAEQNPGWWPEEG
ncbi:MAG: hypothetical protein ACXWES_03945 [Solirubrobacterales bacterium]